MNTNTIMLIVLVLLVIFSAVGIWLANRGSGVDDPDYPEDTEHVDDEDIEDTRDTEAAKDTHKDTH